MPRGLQRFRRLMSKILGISKAFVIVTSNVFSQQSTRHDFVLKNGNILKQHPGTAGKLQNNVSALSALLDFSLFSEYKTAIYLISCSNWNQ